MSKRMGVAAAFLSVVALVSGAALAAAQGASPIQGMAVPGYTQGSVANRAELIADALRMWNPGPEPSADQLATALRRASVEQLGAVLKAGSYREVNAILAGPETNGLGSATEDYTYTAVAPCRIVDTRVAGGTIAAAGTRDFYVYGSAASLTPQGGNAAGCASPNGEPRAVHINIAAIPAGAGPGNVRVYPQNIATPKASAVNFTSDIIANALVVQTYYAIGPREIQIYASNAVDVVIDVMGYFYGADLTMGSGKTARGIWGVWFNATGVNNFGYPTISFPLPLASAAASPNANFITGTPTTNCPGSAASPSAAAGQLCAYASWCQNATLQCFADGTGCSTTATTGATLSLQSVGAGIVNCFGTWAVTAP